MTPGQNSTWNYDPGSKFHVESWPRVTIPHWIVIPIPGHNLMLNHDSGSTFNVESRPGVIIKRGIKTWGSQFNGGSNFIRRRGRNTMTPCLGGRNSTWKIRWILSTVRWIKTPRVEIQWGQNSILHRQSRLYSAYLGANAVKSVAGARLTIGGDANQGIQSPLTTHMYMYVAF